MKINLIRKDKEQSEFREILEIMPEVIGDEARKLKKPRNILMVLGILLALLLTIMLRNPQLFLSERHEKVFKSPVIFRPDQE